MQLYSFGGRLVLLDTQKAHLNQHCLLLLEDSYATCKGASSFNSWPPIALASSYSLPGGGCDNFLCVSHLYFVKFKTETPPPYLVTIGFRVEQMEWRRPAAGAGFRIMGVECGGAGGWRQLSIARKPAHAGARQVLK